MKSERVKKSIKLLVLIAVFTVVVFVVNLLVNRNESVSDFISNLTSKKKIVDTYNGVYTYKEKLESKISASTSCSVEYIDNYILVINDEYLLFRSSCMGTYQKGSGKTEDLNIVLNGDTYLIKYEGNQYDRDYQVLNIIPNNKISIENDTYLDLNSLPGIIKETMFEGNYYKISRKISGINNADIKVKVEHQHGNNFSMEFIGKNNSKIYGYEITNPNKMPLYYGFGSNLVMLERESTEDKYAYRFKTLTTDGLDYNLENILPIKIDDVTLDYNSNSIFIVYDSGKRKFKMFVGFDKKFCVNNGDQKKIAYYEFNINYNYSVGKFDNPSFVNVWYESDGCSNIEEYLKEAV